MLVGKTIIPYPTPYNSNTPPTETQRTLAPRGKVIGLKGKKTRDNTSLKAVRQTVCDVRHRIAKRPTPNQIAKRLKTTLTPGREGLGVDEGPSETREPQGRSRPITINDMTRWQQMSEDERQKITMAGFAAQNAIDPDLWKQYVKADGTLKRGGQKLLQQAAKKMFKPITAELITRWQQLSEAARQKITMDDFAEQNNLNPALWKRNVKANGVPTDVGTAKINKAAGAKIQTITTEHIVLWQKLSQPERDQIKLTGFAKEHAINYDRWSRLVNKNGGLKSDGQKMISRAAGTIFKLITAELLTRWQNLSQKERNKITMDGFAKRNTINPVIWKRYISADGVLTKKGKTKLDKTAGKIYQPITPRIITLWQQMAPEARKQITMAGFAELHVIDPKQWSYIVKSNGELQPIGLNMLKRAEGKKYQPITAEMVTRWQKMDSNERNHTTKKGFAEQNNINPRQWYLAVKDNGERNIVGQAIVDRAEGAKYGPITVEHITRWQLMSQSERDQLTMTGFAVEYNISPILWGRYVKVDGGLHDAGKTKMGKEAGKQYQPITTELIIKWQTMGQEKRDQLTMGGFAEQKSIDPVKWIRYVKRDGGLRGEGQTLLDQAAGEKHRPITAEMITLWQKMTQDERDGLTRVGFAVRHHLHPLRWESTVKSNGELCHAGKAMMGKATGKPYQNITGAHIMRWQRMLPHERNEETRRDFAEHNHLDPGKWRKTVTLKGQLKNNGEYILDKETGKKYDPIRHEHIACWQKMTQEERRKITLRGYAKQNNLEPIKWIFKMTSNGRIRRHNLAMKNKMAGNKCDLPSAVHDDQATLTPIAPLPDVIVLPEDAAVITSRHQVNDDLPVLRDPGDDVTSILVREEGDIDQIKVTGWAGLRDTLKCIPTTNQQFAVKAAILDEMKKWLYTEGRHAGRFDDMMEVRLPHDGPPRGKTVYARRKITQFEVLGPYAGILHKTSDSLHREMRALGGGAVLAYLWETRAQGRSVSGFPQGNTLSLINTSQLTQTSVAWKHNNVGAVRVGKNLTFYVALEDINAGEELLISYGETYNPTGVKIKEEHCT